MAHKELLGNKEIQMLKYLALTKKAKEFRMLKMRIKRNYQTISEDFELVSKAKNRFNNLFP